MDSPPPSNPGLDPADRPAASPRIARVVLTFTETSFDLNLGRPVQSVHESGMGTISCSNPMCRGGGLHLAEVLAPLRETRERSANFNVACRGTEGYGTGKGRVRRVCMNRFEGKVEVLYLD